MPIRNFRAIIESLAKWGAAEKNPQFLVEYVRQDLRRVLSSYYAVNQTTLQFYDLAPDITRDSDRAMFRYSVGAFVDPRHSIRMPGALPPVGAQSPTGSTGDPGGAGDTPAAATVDTTAAPTDTSAVVDTSTVAVDTTAVPDTTAAPPDTGSVGSPSGR